MDARRIAELVRHPSTSLDDGELLIKTFAEREAVIAGKEAIKEYHADVLKLIAGINAPLAKNEGNQT